MPSKKQSLQNRETSLRHVWLASLGAVVVVRRELGTASRLAADNASRLRDGAVSAAADALAIARGGALVLREQVEPKVGQFSADVEARLQPVLAKFGIALNAGVRTHRARRRNVLRHARHPPRARRAESAPEASFARRDN